jgi:hypothetical protein
MPLRAHIVDPGTGKRDPELSAPIDPDWLQALFAHPGISEARFPLLCRLREHHSGSHFAAAELPDVLDEVHKALMLFSQTEDVVGDPFGRFYGTFKWICMFAAVRKHDVDVCVE